MPRTERNDDNEVILDWVARKSARANRRENNRKYRREED